MNAGFLVALGLMCYSVSGVVEDPYGLALTWASVVVEDIGLGTSTDESGSFRIEVPDSIEKGTLTISYIGYTEARHGFSSDERSVRVVLKPENIAVTGIDVSGNRSPSQTEGIGAKTALDQMDVYTTPGASADLFHTLKTLPAFSGEADIASIAIRGGSPHEVLIALNGLPLKHPFLYYQSTGGLFSIIDENSLQTIEAFPGPLPPAYGGGMSGGVLFETHSAFDRRLSIGLSMANTTLTMTHPATGGVWFSRSYYDRLASKVSLSDEAAVFPSFWTMQWSHRAQLGSCHVTPVVLIARSRTDLDLSDLGFETMNDSEHNEVLCISGGCVAEHWTIESTVGYTRYRSAFILSPVLEKYRDEKSYFSRTSITYHISSCSALMVGGEAGKDHMSAHGVYEDLGTQDTFYVQGEYLQQAAFVAHRFNLGSLTAMYGFRPVRQQSRVVSLDPRCLTEFKLDETSRLRLSAGRMSQCLSFEDTVGDYADHFTCSIEKQSSIGGLNLDIYCKRYKSGGQALGLEGIVRFNTTGAESWIGFALMHGQDNDGVALDHDVPARLLAVLSIPVRSWILGLNCHWAVGRPYTPLASTMDSAGATLPVWSEENSARLPNVFRLNCRIARLFRIGDHPLFFYLEGYNLTDHENVTSYCYSLDYEERKPIVIFPRMIYLGVVITL